jgi:hypothetical protein
MLIRLAAIACAAALAAPPALACSCSCIAPDPARADKWIEGAAYVLRGRVVSSRREKTDVPSGEAGEIYSVRPSVILKGSPADELTLYSPPSGGACGVRWPVGTIRNIIAVRSDDGRLRVNICAQLCAEQDGVFKRLDALP